MSRRLLEVHGGKVPNDRDALEALPGVGRKTANVVLNSAFGHPTIAVDTHVFRVANRTGLAPGKTPRRGRAAGSRRWCRSSTRARPPLADPARPLRLHRAQAQVPRVRGARPVRLSGQDGLRATANSRCRSVVQASFKFRPAIGDTPRRCLDSAAIISVEFGHLLIVQFDAARSSEYAATKEPALREQRGLDRLSRAGTLLRGGPQSRAATSTRRRALSRGVDGVERLACRP